MSVLTDEQVLAMRSERAMGATLTELVVTYGVSQTAVWMAVRGYTYQNVGGPIENCDMRKKKHQTSLGYTCQRVKKLVQDCGNIRCPISDLSRMLKETNEPCVTDRPITPSELRYALLDLRWQFRGEGILVQVYKPGERVKEKWWVNLERLA